MKAIQYLQLQLLFLMTWVTLSAQQNPQPHFWNFNTHNGLPSPEVYCVLEDSKGYMWFGTDNGAARFDGYEFKAYGAKEGLMSNVVFDIYEDKKGRIWFGTMTGEAFILEKDTILPYEYNHLVAAFRGKFGNAGLVHLEKDETAYFELSKYGLLKIDKEGELETILGKLPYSFPIIHFDNFKRSIRLLCERRDLENYHQWSYSQEKDKVHYIDVFYNEKRFQKRLSVINFDGSMFDAQKLPSGELLVFGGDVLHCLIDTQLVWSIPFIETTNEIIIEDEAIWLCHSKGNGLRKYADLEALKQNRYEQFLNDLSISNVLKDSKGGYWIATQEKGVYYAPDINLLTYNSQFGFSDDFVHSVSFKNKNELFAGIENGDIAHVDLKENKIINYIINPEGHHNFDLYYDHESDILYSGFSKWVDGKWEIPTVWVEELKRYLLFNGKPILKIHSVSENEIIGSDHTSFYILDKNSHFVTFQSKDIIIERIFAIHSDHTNRLWVGNSRGIFEFKDSAFVHPGIEHPAFHYRVEDIDEMQDSTIVFCTKGFGVILWRDTSFLQLTNDDGLTSNMMEDVHVDENNILWAATLNGLNKISFDVEGNPKIRQFTVSNGLPSNEIYQIKSYEGQVWLCTAGGLVKFREPPFEMVAPTPIIQWVKANGEEMEFLNRQQYQYDENNFEFHYLAINCRQHGTVPYRYRLNKNRDWQYTQSLSVNYPSLPSGDYTFEVQSQNEDKFWSDSKIYEFLILPAWWATRWFQSLSILVLALVGFRLYKYRTNQLKKENELQRQLTALEKSALQAQMNPHFIFNCLNSIQNFILENDRKKAVEYLSRFAKLVRHNLNASVDGEVALEEEISLLDNYLALERERFGQRFEYKIDVASELKKEFVELPPMLIQPYVENAVIHGLSKKEEGGKVNIHFSKNNGNLVVEIRDNGKGYRQEKDEKTTEHKSVGMSITRKRLELLGTDPLNSVLIQPIKNIQNELEGTKVTIQIKIKK